MSSLDNFKGATITLVIVALLIAAYALALDAFQDDIEDNSGLVCANESNWFNVTSGACQYNSTNNTNANGGLDYTYNVTQEGLESLANASSFMSTLGTLLGVSALIMIVIGAFYIVRK